MRLIAALLLTTGCVIGVPARTLHMPPPIAATQRQPPDPPPYAPLSGREGRPRPSAQDEVPKRTK
jgi:hypothetical protein